MDLIIPEKMYLNYQYDVLLRIASKIRRGDSAKLDLKKVTFIRPEAIILLIVLSDELFQKTLEPVCWINIDKNVHSYINRMEIDKLDFINIPPVQKQFQWNKAQSTSNNLTELLVIKNHKDCEAVMSHTKGMIIRWFPDKVGHDYCRIIPTLISDIAGNSLDHSTSNKKNGICYFLAQKYTGFDTTTKIVVSFGDSGIGIHRSLKNSHKWVINDDLHAIKEAFLNGASCRIDDSGGFGFQSVKSILHKHGGEVTIRSGTGALNYDPKKDLRSDTFSECFLGTQTTFIL